MVKYNVAFVSVPDINDRNNWSGTLFYCKKHLAKYFNVVDFSPLRDNLKYLYYPYKLILKKMFRKNYMPIKKRAISKYYSRQVQKLLQSRGDINAIFCMGVLPVAFVKTDLPIISFTDSVFRGLLDYYPERRNILGSNIREANRVEELALRNADYLFFSSEWACKHAKKYNIDSQKVESIPFGLNLDKVPRNEEVMNYIQSKINSRCCNLLFIGKAWERKGGYIACEALNYLNRRKDISARLVIIGCKPDIKDENIEIIGYLNKNIEKDREIFDKILQKSHFLVLPTRADCSPMVSVEANAFGVPALITRTGGVPSIVDDGVNGFMLDYKADGKAFADKIYEIFSNKKEYRELCIKSRKSYENYRNWNRTAKIISDKIIELIKSRKNIK